MRAARGTPFRSIPRKCMAPLPRAYQWADGSAYINHVELVRKARNAEVPDSFYNDPLMYQGGSDDFIGPCDPVVVASEAFGIDFEAEIAVVTGDVKMGATAAQALDGIRLVMLANDVSLRNLIPGRTGQGLRLFPEQARDGVQPGRRHARRTRRCLAGRSLAPHVAKHLERSQGRHVRRRRRNDFPFRPTRRAHREDAQRARRQHRRQRHGEQQGLRAEAAGWSGPRATSCIAEKRCIETIQDGQPSTEFMKYGDTIRIEMKGKDGQSIFGAIDQEVVAPGAVK